MMGPFGYYMQFPPSRGKRTISQERFSVQLLRTGARSLLGLCLTTEHLAAFQTYYDELTAWNQRFNLTAIIGLREVQIKHFLDSLTCLLAMPSAKEPSLDASTTLPIETSYRPLRCLDVGAGAGFPGLPLKIVRPELKLTLLEATAKKTRFLQHMVAQLGLQDVQVIHGRAEELGHDPSYREQYDVVLARAVARLNTLSEYCLPFCKLGGRFIAQKSAEATDELQEAEQAIDLLGGAVMQVKAVHIAEIAEHRYLINMAKERPTPEKYPRRPGMPSKRPL